MAVAKDSFFSSANGPGNLTISCTPTGTIKGVVCFIAQTDELTDNLSTVTYGSASMTRIRDVFEGGVETVVNYMYFVGSSIPTGNQTLTVTVSGAGDKRAAVYLLTAGNDTEIVDSDETQSASVTNPNVILSAGGRTCICVLGATSGAGLVGNVDHGGGLNTTDLENDHGPEVSVWYSRSTIDTSDVTAQVTQTLEDIALIAALISEVPASSGNPWSAYANQ